MVASYQASHLRWYICAGVLGGQAMPGLPSSVSGDMSGKPWLLGIRLTAPSAFKLHCLCKRIRILRGIHLKLQAGLLRS